MLLFGKKNEFLFLFFTGSQQEFIPVKTGTRMTVRVFFVFRTKKQFKLKSTCLIYRPLLKLFYLSSPGIAFLHSFRSFSVTQFINFLICFFSSSPISKPTIVPTKTPTIKYTKFFMLFLWILVRKIKFDIL